MNVIGSEAWNSEHILPLKVFNLDFGKLETISRGPNRFLCDPQSVTQVLEIYNHLRPTEIQQRMRYPISFENLNFFFVVQFLFCKTGIVDHPFFT